MSCSSTTLALLLLLLVAAAAKSAPTRKHVAAVESVREGMQQAIAWANGGVKTASGPGPESGFPGGALRDCAVLYGDAESRLARLVSGEAEDWGGDDAVTWLSAALAGHNTCLDGLGEMRGFYEAHNLTNLIREASAVYRAEPETNIGGNAKGKKIVPRRPDPIHEGGLLTAWNPATSNVDYVVAQDGSGNYRTINEAVAAIARSGRNRPERVVVHVKSGVYKEKVEIGRELSNIMFVGDGIDKTIVTGNRNVQDGSTTFNSATFGVSGDGFWARDMTFENTAGPGKHQAVALRVASDRAVFYRCSFKGYQDTLFALSLRHFYRGCHVYGTVDFIFGDAAAVLQDCDVFVRRPMDHQSNMITAQGRSDPNQNTGISVVGCRVRPAPELRGLEGRFRSFLGRPWKRYSRTVFMKTNLDGLIDRRGWNEWSGGFALGTLYYAEFMNTGSGATTAGRVRWPGFHVLSDAHEAEHFGVRDFIGGDKWIPATGVPFSTGL
ncbi:pectinesterase-like [Salvia miltiorrhiza]|uniref:pectinesterase-like n=1 Tax=Salvia miltiorrhiza TaxID=226208 RepID=UPI0025ABC2C5|nr:pectinesterase-like [Salvia miltiorrhiza]